MAISGACETLLAKRRRGPIVELKFWHFGSRALAVNYRVARESIADGCARCRMSAASEHGERTTLNLEMRAAPQGSNA